MPTLETAVRLPQWQEKPTIGTPTWMRAFADTTEVEHNDLPLLIARMEKDSEHWTALLKLIDDDSPPDVALDQQEWYAVYSAAAAA